MLTLHGYEVCFSLTKTLSADIQLTAKAIGCTPFSIILAVYFLSLHEYCAKDDIVIGTPALGRIGEIEEKMVGNFISLVTIRSLYDNSLNKSINDYINKIHKGVFQAIKHQSYQYDELLFSLGLELEQDSFPLTTFFISMLDKRGSRADNMDDAFIHKPMGNDVKFDMMLYVDNYEDLYVLRSQYRRALFSEKDQENFWRNFIKKLKQICCREEAVCGLC
ncbi:condensation domain-containing protein [Fangia hongkongensis]|uniref:condensation domain-containing protein n=1 Tax=Fangia hongkongensis TaxID=270495 RepID=UPI00039C1E51|nr:condensation domain-containing protein [Fangia hongkongensis]